MTSRMLWTSQQSMDRSDGSYLKISIPLVDPGKRPKIAHSESNYIRFQDLTVNTKKYDYPYQLFWKLC